MALASFQKLTMTEPRQDSSMWLADYKKDYDPEVAIRPSVFEDVYDKKKPTDSTLQDNTVENLSPPDRVPSIELAPLFQNNMVGSSNYAEAHRVSSTDSFLRAFSGFDKILGDFHDAGQDRGMTSYNAINRLFVTGNGPTERAQTPPPSNPVASAPVLVTPRQAAIMDSKDMEVSPSDSNSREYVETDEIRDIDVLCGKGGKTNAHFGNKRYRKIVNEWKKRYLRPDLSKTDKTKMSRHVTDLVMSDGDARYLKQDEDSEGYYVMTKAQARRKTVQGLREKKQFKWTTDK